MTDDEPVAAALPRRACDLAGVAIVARRLLHAMRQGEGLCLLRFGDTGGRIMARPKPGTAAWAYIAAFLGRDVSPEQVEWLAIAIEQAVGQADIAGLRSDLIGPDLPADLLSRPDDQILPELRRLYPIRAAERETLDPDSARRLAETRAAMQRFRLRADAVLTNAWVHVDLAQTGFFAALMKEAPSFGLVTSSVRKPLVAQIAARTGGRLRYYECPAYPAQEQAFGGNHGFIWHRWQALCDALAPAWPGEPLLVSAGIWTKPLAVAWRERGGVAVDFGSVLDYFDGCASRPAVLSDRFGDGQVVPVELTLAAQFARTERLVDFL